VDVAALMVAEKGGELTVREHEILAERVASASRWLDMYAAETAKITVRRDAAPAEIAALGAEQRLYLGALALAAELALPAGGDDWQNRIFEVAAEAAIPAGRAFGALYVAFLGRPNGPRAGWLLASLEPDFVIGRLREAAGWRRPPAEPSAPVAR
jgi:lysyl-tRNA synthetase class 1